MWRTLIMVTAIATIAITGIRVPDIKVNQIEIPKKEKQGYTTIHNATVYGYSSTEDQTDSTPFITASQIRVREGIVANNCLPYGSKIKIKDKVYEVQDRMNSKYGCEVFDIWFETREEAIQWGKRKIEIYIYEQDTN